MCEYQIRQCLRADNTLAQRTLESQRIATQMISQLQIYAKLILGAILFFSLISSLVTLVCTVP